MLNLKGRDLGRYHLIEPLGEGGMALVYKAYDATLDRNVAIKVIRTEMGGDPAFLQRFQREAKALARLDHPYILKVLDYGEQDGMPYLVMPFVAGGTLKAKMGQPIAPAETARILAPVARALAYAHQQGIIHRDVKPANILITPTGAPTLSDFGIAKLLEQEGKNQLTATGVGMGTPDYMAPEQWLGTVDARTDIYALGVILFQMITGRLPYTADTPAAVLLKHMQDPLPRPGDFVPGLADAVERVIFKSLAKEPTDRFQTMDDFADALEKVAQGAAQSPEAALPAPARGAAAPLPVARPAPAPRPAPMGAAEPAAYAAQPGSGQPAGTAPAPARRGTPWLAIGGGAVALLVVVCLVAAAAGLLWRRANQQKANPSPTDVPEIWMAPLEDTPPAATQPGDAPSGDSPASTLPPALPSATPVQPEEATPTEPAPGATEPGKPPLTKIEGLPEDIPILKDNNGDLIKQESADSTMFMYSTALSTQEAADFFKPEMERLGWTIENTTTMETQDTVMYFFQKDTRMVMISIASASNQTMVIVQLIPQNP